MHTEEHISAPSHALWIFSNTTAKLVLQCLGHLSFLTNTLELV